MFLLLYYIYALSFFLNILLESHRARGYPHRRSYNRNKSLALFERACVLKQRGDDDDESRPISLSARADYAAHTCNGFNCFPRGITLAGFLLFIPLPIFFFFSFYSTSFLFARLYLYACNTRCNISRPPPPPLDLQQFNTLLIVVEERKLTSFFLFDSMKKFFCFVDITQFLYSKNFLFYI